MPDSPLDGNVAAGKSGATCRLRCGKGRAAVARLAGVLELLAWSGSGAPGLPGHIGCDQVEAAVDLWTGYFRPHARAVFDGVAPTDFSRRVRRVARWLKDSRATVVSREDVRCHALSRAGNADDAQQVLHRLDFLGFVRPDLADDGGGRGRPARRWRVNPALANGGTRLPHYRKYRKIVMRYRAVLFDVGGPLDLEFAREIAVDSAIASACGLEGIRVDQAMIEEASEAAVAAFAPDAYAHMIETLCGGEPRAVDRVRQRVRAMMVNVEVFQLRPDIDGLLRRLRGRGLKLGIIANQPPAARERLARAGIGDFFDHLGLSGLTGFRKPDPRAFQAAAAALGIPPAACIMVGDRLDNDIAPAKALGMAAIQLRGGRHRRQRPRAPAEEPDAVVTDVRELEAAIDALIAQ